MDWLIVFCYIIFAYGISNLLVYGQGPFDILEKFRTFMGKIHPMFKELFSCMMCLPTNVGWIFSLCNILLFPWLPLTPFFLLINNVSMWWLIIPMDMCFTSGAVWLINTVQEAIESITNKNTQE